MTNVVRFQKPRTYTTAEALIEKVRTEIFENGSTYKMLAFKAGVSTATVQRLANGKTRWPRPTTLFPLLFSMGLALRVVRDKEGDRGQE